MWKPSRPQGRELLLRLTAYACPVVFLPILCYFIRESRVDVLVTLCLTTMAAWIAWGMQAMADAGEDDADAPLWLRSVVLTVLLSIVIAGAAIYGTHGNPIDLAVTVVGIGAALATGGILGFLFGIPRVLQDSAGKIERPGNTPGYSPNTNLERISDWLTTIIVGLTLAQFSTIVGYFDRAVVAFSGELSTHQQPFLAGALLVFYGVAGFFVAYLWTRIRLTRDFEDADRPVRKDPEYYEGLMNAYLYSEPPLGFQRVIDLGTQYLRHFSTVNGRIWLYLACAYGQLHSYLTDPPLGVVKGSDNDVKHARDAAYKFCRRALEADPTQTEFLETLLKGGPEAVSGEDDLRSLAPDEAFDTLLKQFGASASLTTASAGTPDSDDRDRPNTPTNSNPDRPFE
jgi:hypothetical protein